jgi:adenylate cyclase
MELDEAGTLAALKQRRREVLGPLVTQHNGRVVKLMGDGVLVEFSSAVDAVECAIELQKGFAAANQGLSEARRIVWRVGINLGDVVVEGSDLYGDGVNVAARLETLADPGSIFVSRSVYDQVKRKLACGFDELGPRAVKNIAEPVHVYRVRHDHNEPKHESLPLPTKPSIPVLPFSVMSTDPEQGFFADGLVEDILTTLAKLSGLSVIARHSSFAYKGRAVDVRQVARELGVRFVLEGSVRKASSRIRITAQLIDATTGIHIWADRFDRSINDIFAVEDEITLTLATEMQVRLTEGEQARLRYTTTTNVEAWSLWIEGLNHNRRPDTTDSHVQARRCWEKALALDPGSAVLNAMLSDVHYSDARHGWTGEDRETALKKAEAYLARALAIDPENPDAHRSASGILLLKSRFNEAAAAARKAAKFGPNMADVLVFGGFVLTCCGSAAEGVGQIERVFCAKPDLSGVVSGCTGQRL